MITSPQDYWQVGIPEHGSGRGPHHPVLRDPHDTLEAWEADIRRSDALLIMFTLGLVLVVCVAMAVVLWLS